MDQLLYFIFFPLVAALGVSLTPSPKFARRLTQLATFFHFLWALYLLVEFDPTSAQLQFVVDKTWIRPTGTRLLFGIDGISVWLVLLTTFFLHLTAHIKTNLEESQFKSYYLCLLGISGTALGTFLSLDALVFYVFFEASLIPLFMLIGIWGGKDKIFASIKFFVFTIAGSAFMLLGIIALMFLAEDQLGTMTTSLLDFYRLQIPFVGGELASTQALLFFCFAFAFAVKVPLFPLHTWLPNAHVEAPTAGSVLLAGIMLKMGAYGFIRFCLPLFPGATLYWGWIFLMLSLIGIFYGGLVAFAQTDLKKVIAYSSVSHMGYIILGLFAFNSEGVSGAIFQILAHAVSTGGLFILVGILYAKSGSRRIVDFGGLAEQMPRFAILFMICTLSSIALPSTSGFVGEFLILFGLFKSQPVFASIAVFGVVVSAVYMLNVTKRVMFGHILAESPSKIGTLSDLNLKEVALMSPLVALIFLMGVYPKLFLNSIEKSVEHLVSSKGGYYLSISSSGKMTQENEQESVSEVSP